jgi:hypothetical protein
MKVEHPLDAIEKFLRRFLILPNERDYTIAVLWVAHTYFTDRIPTSPRLAIISPEYGCGKSRFLEVLESLCYRGEKLDHQTRSYLMRMVELTVQEYGKPPTLLIDEIDAVWKSNSEDGEALRAFVNTGYRNTGYYGITEGEGKNRKPTKFRTFAPIAIAGKGEVLPESVMTRSHIIRLQKRSGTQTVEKFLNRDVKNAGEELNEWLQAWSESVGEDVTYLDLILPVEDREEEIWSPLFQVAYVAGGDWYERVLKALNESRVNSQDDSMSSERQVLADTYKITEGLTHIRSSDLVDKLINLNESDYGHFTYGRPISDRTLAKCLRPYEIKSKQIRFPSGSFKGYEVFEIVRAYQGYVPRVPTPLEIETEETRGTLD